MISVFLSCPVRPLEDSTETKDGNLALALEYYRVLSTALPDYAFIMPWWVNCKVFPETAEQIALGMERNCFWINKCHQLWWCGPRVSGGMKDEGEWAKFYGTPVKRLQMDRTARGIGIGEIIVGGADFSISVSLADAELFEVAA